MITITTATTDLAVVAASLVVRSGLAQLLAAVPGVRVTHQLDSIARLAAQRPPALVVIDLHGQSGSAPALLPPGTKAIVLCAPEDPPNLLAALRSGVHGLITRESTADDLRTAIRVARQGGLHIAAELFDSVVERATPRRGGDRELTDREVQALRLVAEGFTHGQVSRRMGLTETTVNTYVKRIRYKLNVGNKAELTRRAIELGYLTPPR